jgi:hypothetical protein
MRGLDLLYRYVITQRASSPDLEHFAQNYSNDANKTALRISKLTTPFALHVVMQDSSDQKQMHRSLRDESFT